MSSLELRKVTVSFKGLTVLSELDLGFGERSMNVLIGPNGAGKTTVLNALSGAVRPAGGEVWLDADDVTGESPTRFARRGVVRKFQVPTVFPGLTVADNLRVASSAPRPRATFTSGERDTRQRELSETLGLADRYEDLAADLSHGQRQWLEMGMAFLGDPRFLLLDEPAAGLGPGETQHTADLIKLMAERCCVIAVEHDMDFVRALGGEVTVLHQGALLARGTFKQIEKNTDVRDVYLGRGH
ncbi:MAG: ATP-binding cassette domain-containing protein [Pseudolysinimonas sp.]